jgi:hypothetical protein
MDGRTKGTARAPRAGERHLNGRHTRWRGPFQGQRGGRAPPKAAQQNPMTGARRGRCSAHGAPLLATDSTSSRAGQSRPGGNPVQRAPDRSEARNRGTQVKGTPGRSRRRGPLTVLLDKIDEKVTRRADVRAQELGLQISRVPGTRTQVYRDPRWDRRRECGCCSGTGLDGAQACDSCTGTGVTTSDATVRAGGTQ